MSATVAQNVVPVDITVNGVELVEWDALPKASAIVATVAHAAYANMATATLTDKLADNGVFVDVKSFFDRKALTEAGVRVWRL